MRMATVAILLVLSTLGAARADAEFKDDAQHRWELPLWESSPLPVPQGWNIEKAEAKVEGMTGYILRGLPPGKTWSGDWIDEGFIIWRFQYGAPSGATRDALHLTILKSITGSSEKLDLRLWEDLDGIRASLHEVTGSAQQREYNLMLSHWADPANVISVFTSAEEWESSGAQEYAGKLLQALSGLPGIAEKVAALELDPSMPPQQPPYEMAAETKPTTWMGQTLHLPKDWQVAYRPIDSGIAEGNSMSIKASPNLADEDAPNLLYARWSDKKGEPIDLLKQLIEGAKAQDPSFATLRISRISNIACLHAKSKGEQDQEMEGFGCVGRSEIDGVTVTEYVGFEAPKDQFEALGGKRLPLLMTREVDPDALDENLIVDLEPAKRLLTTRETPPFPALVPVGQYRAPVDWDAEMSFLDGEFRFLGPEENSSRPMLAYRARADTGTDAEIALTNLIEDYGITDFVLDHSDYLDGANGLIAVGTGKRDGSPIKFGAIAEKDDPSIYVFVAEPEQFDAMGGAALLAPVFLKHPPDSFENIDDPAKRIAIIAKTEGERIVRERKEMRELKLWQQKMEAQSIMNAYNSMSLAIACGGWC